MRSCSRCQPGIIPVHVETEDFAEQGVDVLSVAGRVTAPAAVAERDVKIAVGAEPEPAALVIAEAVGLVDADHQRSGGRVGLVGIGRGDLVAPHFGIVAGVGEVDEKAPVVREIRIEGEAEQTALARGVDLSGEIEERRC